MTEKNEFFDFSSSCMTGGLSVPLDLDSFRPDKPCNENWICWFDEVPVIGLIDAPSHIPAGGCEYVDDLFFEGSAQITLRR